MAKRLAVLFALLALPTLAEGREIRCDRFGCSSKFIGNAIKRAAREPVSLSGVVLPLAHKARQIVSSCGSRVIRSVRRTNIAGTRRLSLHAYGRAVDLQGNPRCIYRMLSNWPGGYSTDYRAVQHVHVSYHPNGREWGVRFAHARVSRRNLFRQYAKQAE